MSYSAFVAPAMLAASAMNGALAETTFNFFAKLKWVKLYDAMVATPLRPFEIALGELAWALIRGPLYSVAFLGLMVALGLTTSAGRAGAARVDAGRLRVRRPRHGDLDHCCGPGRTSTSSAWSSSDCSCSPARSYPSRPTRPCVRVI